MEKSETLSKSNSFYDPSCCSFDDDLDRKNFVTRSEISRVNIFNNSL